MKKNIVKFIILFVVLFFVHPMEKVYAGASGGIAGNGLGGISIDVNASPYTDYANIPIWGQYAYGPSGCAWFASARVKQLTGKGDTIYSGQSWYDSAYSSFGFSRGQNIAAPAIICWSGHVAILEKIVGDKAYISEGGNSSVGGTNGYTIIREVNVSQVETINANFLGYVYFNNSDATDIANNPIGFVDSIIAGDGYIDVKGWALDKDIVGMSIDVHIYIGGSCGTPGADGYSVKANVSRKDVDDVYHVGEFHGFETRIYTTRTGNQPVYVYAINVGDGNLNTELKNITVNISKDTEKPTITDIKVYDITKDGYTVSCKVADNCKIAQVKFPSWNVVKNEPLWIDGKIIGNTATARINIFDLSGVSREGLYNTHIYAYDASGNSHSVSINNNKGIYIDRTPPIISEVTISNITSKGYTIKCKVEDNASGIDCVKFPTWTELNGQDDLNENWINQKETYIGKVENGYWTYNVDIANHNYETGNYFTHIYAWDKYGNIASYQITPCNNIKVPEKDNVESEIKGMDTQNVRPSNTETFYEVSEPKKEEQIPKQGTVFVDSNSKYMVTNSNISNPTIAYKKSINSKAKTITIPDTVKVDGITYKVTSVAANALANNKKVTKVTVGKNVTSIGKNAFKKCTKLKTVTLKSTSLKLIGSNAFYGDKNLKTITIKSSKLTSKSVGKNAFKGTNKKLTIKVPKKKVSSYKKFLKKKGNSKVTVKKA